MQQLWQDRRLRRSVAHWALVALTLVGCGGGGGGGSDAIAPYWVSADLVVSDLVVSDLDGDGRVDVAVATTYVAGAPPHAGYVAIYRQRPDATFAPALRYAVGADPWGLVLGDVDGDGRPDLVASTPMSRPPEVDTVSDSGGVALLRQDPASPGRFLPAQWIDTGGAIEQTALADFDGDGLTDLMLADGVLRNGRALLLRQQAAGGQGFASPLVLSLGNGRGAQAVVAADVDGDSLADAVFGTSDGVVILRRLPGGGFEPPRVLASGAAQSGVAVADLDGDGRADIVAVGPGNAPAGGTGGARLTLLLQSTAGNFTGSSWALPDGARTVAVGDLNGDAIADLAVVSLVYQALTQPSRVSVFLQSPLARGQFTAAAAYDGPRSADAIALGDLDGDGLNDIVLNDGPSVMLQRAVAPGTFTPAVALP